MEINREYYIDKANLITGTYKCCMKQEFHGGINRKYGNLTLRALKNGRLSGTMFPTMFWLDSSFSFGSYDGKEIRVIDYPLEDEEMKNMQEDVNVILSRLMKDEKFVLA